MRALVQNTQLDHVSKVEQLKQRHDRLEKLKGKPGPRHNMFLKMRREQFKEQSHAGKS